jgi:hypothetical protein
MPQVASLGTATITVEVGASSDSGTINVIAPALPQLQAGNGSEPVTAFTFGGIDVTMSSKVGDIFLLFWSPNAIPSTMPGVVSLEIGNNFAQLFHVNNYTIPAKAWDLVHLPLGAVPPLTTFYLEGVVIRAGGLAYPLDTSNKQQCQVLF